MSEMKLHKTKSTPILFFELKNNIVAILFILILMSMLITIIMNKLVDNNITNILDRTLVVARTEYNRFYKESINSFSLFNRDLAIKDVESLQQIVSKSSNYDFWFVVENDKIIDSSGQRQSTFSTELLKIAALCRHQKNPVASSELSTLADLYQFSHQLGQKQSSLQPWLQEDDFSRTPVLFQVVAIPLFAESHQIETIIVVGKILNNDNTIAENINLLIPGTNSSISVRNGLRISGNIKSASHDSYIGKLQKREHIDSVYSGRRYYGQIVLEDLNDKIVSEPIMNSRKEIIGALTTGFPYRQFADTKDNITLSIGLIGFVSFLVALATNLTLSRKGSRPLVQLSSLSGKISQAERINAEHIENLKTIKAAEILEIQELQCAFVKMTSSLYEKNIENDAFTAELSRDKNELHHLTTKLHEANAELEQRVRDRTQELQTVVMELTEANKMKTKFLANMSHEIRTPLNSIIGFSDVLYDGSFGSLNKKQQEYVLIILNSAKHLLDLINDILDMSIIDQGRTSLHLQLENPNPLIYSVMNVIQAQADHKKLTTTLDLDESVPAILLDAVRIKQVLYNIINNAIKFTSPGGFIRIFSRYTDGWLIISVADTGIGIANDVLEKVFNEFFQAEHSHNKLFDGVGLGLPLSRKLIEMHKGKIELKSELGAGTTVTLFIPACFI
jgi:signal transduction histidine kinase